MSASPNDDGPPGGSTLSRLGLVFDPEKNTKERQLIDTMDLIRDLSIQSINPVPQLVVCGAQSAGKSSVLGAIAGIPFPSGTKMCTRYVTKVTLNYSSEAYLQVKILPGKSRNVENKTRLRKFEKEARCNDVSQETLSRYMQEAYETILYPNTAETQDINDDILLVKISSPDTRALELVDLPGLIGYHPKDKVTGIIKKIEDLVEEYIKTPQSTILAVVHAGDDFANARILGLCEQHDPAGKRTLGIITKPDTLQPDTQDPEDIVSIIKGEDSSFSKFKWHVVRNLDTQVVGGPTTMKERDEEEALLFSRPPWKDLSPEQRGIKRLISRVGEMHFEAVRKELPRFRTLVEQLLEDPKFNDLTEALPDAILRAAFKESIYRLQTAAREHAIGIYRYDVNKLPDDSPAKLRSRIRERDDDFRDDVNNKGATWLSHAGMQPLDPHPELSKRNGPSTSPHTYTFEDIKAEIRMASEKLRNTGGIELRGHYNPTHINNLFWNLSDGWDGIAEEHVGKIYLCCKDYFDTITKMTFARTASNKRQVGSDTNPDGFENPETVAKNFMKIHLLDCLKRAESGAIQELEKIVEDRRHWAKSSDNRFLVKQKEHRQNVLFRSSIREKRAQQNIPGINGLNNSVLDTGVVAEQRELSQPEDFRDFHAEDQLYDMQSHYEISRDIFISNVLMQVEERHFLRHIDRLIPHDLDLDRIKELTRDENHSPENRRLLQEEKNKLEEAYNALQRCQLA